MNAKFRLLFALAFLLAPTMSLAQTTGDVTSVESLNLGDVANESIVVLSKQESGLPGYVYLKYAFVHPNCLGGFQLVDYYGSTFDPNDPAVRRAERQRCSRLDEDKDGE
jgi:hypothetical protein